MRQFFAQVDQAIIQGQLSGASAQQEKLIAQQDQLFQFIETMQDRLLTFLPLFITVGVLILVLVVINAVNKMRVDRAILRIDKNLEKLITEKALKDTMHPSSSNNPFPNMYTTKPSSSAPSNATAAASSPPDSTSAENAQSKPLKDWYE